MSLIKHPNNAAKSAILHRVAREIALGGDGEVSILMQGTRNLVIANDVIANLHFKTDGDRSSIEMTVDDMDASVLIEGQTDVVSGVWRDLISGVNAKWNKKENLPLQYIPVGITALLAMGAIGIVLVFTPARDEAVPQIAPVSSQNLEAATSLLANLNGQVRMPETIPVKPAIQPAPAQRKDTVSAYVPAASTDRYGISDIPPVDSWARTGTVRLPLPGGGDIKSTGDMEEFGLQP